MEVNEVSRVGSPAIYETVSDGTVRIPTSSGVVLGATLVRPKGEGQFPALVWYDPYRAAWSGGGGGMAQYFATRGYVFVNLHVRGTGNSEGVSRDEYMAEETQDGYDAIQWLAEQPWCNGNVGMLGSSYSGFTSLQVAALAPPALKAIAPAYFTDRRYTDDCHYKGGCLRGYYDTLHYGLWMVAMNAMPPHPKAVGEQWSALWSQRLEESEPYLLKWLAHPTEDTYWSQGSVIGNYDKIKAACLLVDGWHDGYVNPPLRTFRALTAPKRLLIGPWNHSLPHVSHCGPRIDYYFELLRWWDRWLKDVKNGAEDEPRVMIYAQEFEEPIQDRTNLAGRWYVSDDLPTDPDRKFFLGASALRETSSDTVGSGSFAYLPAAARQGGIWDAGMPFGLPGDQRPDEVFALNYTSEPLTEDIVILGQPTIALTVSADVPVLPIACRLCEVGEDGMSVLVTKGILNVTRRNGMETPESLVLNQPTPMVLELEATSWQFTKGNRIRLSINGSDFPNVWPTPYRGQGTIHFGPDIQAEVRLPIWGNAIPSPIEFPASPHTPAGTGSGGDPAPWRVVHDVLEDRYHFLFGEQEFMVSNRDPAHAYTKGKSGAQASWQGFSARSEAHCSLHSDERTFHIIITLNVFVNDTPHFQKQWRQSTQRALL